MNWIMEKVSSEKGLLDDETGVVKDKFFVRIYGFLLDCVSVFMVALRRGK